MLGRILVFIGVLLVLALSAALIAPYFIDWTDFRRDFETQASRIVGKKVVVHGAVDARILPFPSVTMNDVRVGENERGEALITAERFSMESELAPFLSGEALIYNMRIVQPRLKVRLTADGSLDWVKTGKPLIPASSVTLEKVVITDGEIEFIDEQTGRNRIVSGLNLDLSARTLAGPWRIAGTGALDGQAGEFVINTSVPENDQIHLKLRLMPEAPAIVAELDGSLGLKAERPQYTGSFRIRENTGDDEAVDTQADAKSSGAPRLSGDFELQNDRVRVPKYEFKVGNPADPYTVTGEATLDAGRKPEFLLVAEGQQIDMGRFGGDSEGGETGAAIPLPDRIRAFLTLAADVPVPQVPGKATIRLPALVAGDTTIRDIRLEMRPDTDGWQIDAAEAQLPGRTTLSAKGRLSLVESQSFEGELLLASTQPSGFAEWLTGSVPDAIRKLKTAGFSANVNLTPELQRFEKLEIAFGPASLTGRLEREAKSGETPALSTELTGNAFDLDTMLALGGLMTGEARPETLVGHRLSAKLDFDQFSAFGLEATDVEAVFALSSGILSDARIRIGDFYGAALSAEGGIADPAGEAKGELDIKLSASDPTGVFDLLAKRLPPHPVLKRLAENAQYYEGSDFDLHLRLGLGDWPVEAKLTGVAHGSRISANLAAQSLDLSDTGGMTLDAAIENPDAWVMFGQAGLPTMQFDADQDGLLSLKIDQPPDGDPQVNLAFASGSTSLTLEGQAALDTSRFLEGSYKLTVDSDDISPYLFMNGMTLPRMTEGLPLTLGATIYATPEAIGIEGLEGSADGNAFTGILSRDRKAAEPLFAGELNLDNADLGWIASAVFGEVTDQMTAGLSTLPMPQQAGLPLAADLHLSAKSFTLGTIGVVDDFSARLQSSGSKIVVSDAAGRFAKGQFKGRAELANTDGTATLRATMAVDGATLKTAFWKTGDKPAAAATARLSLVVDTAGKTATEMLETATGSGALRLDNLAISGLDGAALTPILAGVDAIPGDLDEKQVRALADAAVFRGASQFAKLDIPFSITGGRIRAESIKAGNADLGIEAQATLGLTDAAVDARLALTFKAGDEALAGAEPVVAIGWQGPLATPSRTVDYTGLVSFLSLRKFEQERRRVDILQAKVEEKQRLRREAALYRAHDAERRRLKEKAEAEARLWREAQQALAEKARQAEEARRKAEPAPDPAPVDGDPIELPTIDKLDGLIKKLDTPQPLGQ